MTEHDQFDDFARARVENASSLVIETPLAQSSSGGSGAFLARASDGRRYWVKSLNNGQNVRVPVTEHLVGLVGQLIGAPSCEVKLLQIPSDIVGWEFRPGRHLELGIANGSLAEESVVEVRALSSATRDTNARRYVGLLALYDLCWGEDPQWLEAGDRDAMVFSHDHGMYLPGGTGWSRGTLEAAVDQPHQLAVPVAGLDRNKAQSIEAAADSLRQEHLGPMIRGLPLAWPVNDDDLAAFARFVMRRSRAMAQRLRALFP